MMRLFVRMVILALLSCVPAAAVAQSAKPAEFVYRMGSVNTGTHPIGVLSEAFKADVEKNSKGRIQIQLFLGGQLGGELEMVNAVRAGSLDMAAVASTAAGSVFPALSF